MRDDGRYSMAENSHARDGAVTAITYARSLIAVVAHNAAMSALSSTGLE